MIASRAVTRVALVCANPARSGGSLLSTIEFANAARELGNHVSLICIAPDGQSSSLSAEYLGSLYKFIPIHANELSNYLKTTKFHTVIASTSATFAVLHAAAKVNNQAFNVIVRGGTYGPKGKFDRVQRAAVEASTHIGCVSVSLQDQLERDFGRKIKLLPTPLPNIKQERRRKHRRRPVLTYVGRFSSRKRVDVIPTIISETIAQGIQVGGIRLIGEGPLKSRVIRSLSSIAVPLHSEPWVDHSNVLANLRASDYMLAPSSREGRPRAVLEAISAGIIPLMSDIPAHCEFFSREHAKFTWREGRPIECARLIAKFQKQQSTRSEFWSSLSLSPGRREFENAVSEFLNS